MALIPLAQLVRNAIGIEEAAAAFYRDLAEGASEIRVRAFLLDMADQEVQHARQIAEFGTKLAGGELPQAPDFAVEDVECAPGWRDARDLTMAQALDVARESEIQAYLFYDAVADRLTGNAATFFRVLAKTEQEHLKALQRLQAV